MRIAGVISGTSLDGIDVALCEVRAHGDGVRVRCERFATVPFDEALRARIAAAYPPAPVGALEVSALHAAVGAAFGAAVRAVADGAALDAVASHGLTLAHDDAARETLQIGDAFRIREQVAATVVYDFRSADTAAGGTGAPLVPFVDALLFGAARALRRAQLGRDREHDGAAGRDRVRQRPGELAARHLRRAAQRRRAALRPRRRAGPRGPRRRRAAARAARRRVPAPRAAQVDRARAVRRAVRSPLARAAGRAVVRGRARDAERVHRAQRRGRACAPSRRARSC